MASLSRIVMALAVSCLGHHRREWALAMEVEFEAAREDGKPLAFALGCLMAAWRELPAHQEGRFAIASHVLALAFLIPAAALLLSNLLADFPLSFLGQSWATGRLELIGGHEPLLSDANRSAVPPLAALVMLLAGCQARLAWLVLERDWARVKAVGMLMAAATVTLTIFTIVVFGDCASGLAQAALLAVEFAALFTLERWSTGCFSGRPEALS